MRVSRNVSYDLAYYTIEHPSAWHEPCGDMVEISGYIREI